MGGGGMILHIYTLRAATAAALHGLLAAASAGKPRPYAWTEGEDRVFDEARVRLPYPETAEGDGIDPETGAPVPVATGYWLCTVALVDEEDPDLAALSVVEIAFA